MNTDHTVRLKHRAVCCATDHRCVMLDTTLLVQNTAACRLRCRCVAAGVLWSVSPPHARIRHDFHLVHYSSRTPSNTTTSSPLPTNSTTRFHDQDFAQSALARPAAQSSHYKPALILGHVVRHSLFDARVAVVLLAFSARPSRVRSPPLPRNQHPLHRTLRTRRIPTNPIHTRTTHSHTPHSSHSPSSPTHHPPPQPLPPHSPSIYRSQLSCVRYLSQHLDSGRLAAKTDTDDFRAQELLACAVDAVGEGCTAWHAIDTTASYSSQAKETQPFIDTFVSKRLPKWLQFFESALKGNGGEFFIGSELSYVDVYIFQWLHGVEFQCPEVYNSESIDCLRGLKERVEKRPGIAERVKSRNKYDGTGPCF